MIRLFLILTSFFALHSIGQSQGLEFYREDLTFYLKNGCFELDGIYFFCNTSKDTTHQVLFYPFPEDPGYQKFDSASVINLTDGSVIMYKTKKDFSGIYFPVTVSPYKSVKIKVYYRQRISGNIAEYILLTTHAWKKPFEVVNYRLIADKGIVIENISYTPDSVYNDSTGTNYLWRKRDFMPDRNFLFEFTTKN